MKIINSRNLIIRSIKKMKKTILQHIIIQLLRTGDKEKNLKTSRGKGYFVNRGPKIKMTANIPFKWQLHGK